MKDRSNRNIIGIDLLDGTQGNENPRIPIRGFVCTTFCVPEETFIPMLVFRSSRMYIIHDEGEDMKTLIVSCMIILLAMTGLTAKEKDKSMEAPFYTFTMKTIDGKEKPLADYKGKVVMVVNTASFCGFTPQYKDLEALYKEYKEKGFVIAGFPANNFGKQEPGNDKDIASFCEKNYGVSFDMFSKISVKGNDMHPLYKYLTTETNFKGDIGWNFTKFLIDKNGNVAARYESRVKPNDKEIVAKIDELLKGK